MMSARKYFVYFLTNRHDAVLYIGVTNDISSRVYQHKQKLKSGFTQKYNITKLVYYETFSDVISAIEREKQLKRWHKEWKWNLIKENNPKLVDLYDTIL